MADDACGPGTSRSLVARAASVGHPVSTTADLARELRQRADAVTLRVLYGDEPRVDLEIAMDALREWVRANLPDRLWLYDAVYGARWRRFAEQGWERPRPAV